jgi:LSM domain-containing protein
MLTHARPVTGTLKGYDALMNLVLDDVEEVMRGESRSLALGERNLMKISQMMRATRQRARWAWSSQEAHYSSSSAPSTAASRSPTPSPSPKTIELDWHDGRGSNTHPAQAAHMIPRPCCPCSHIDYDDCLPSTGKHRTEEYMCFWKGKIAAYISPNSPSHPST